MADKNQINTSFGLDASAASASLQKLENDLKGIASNLVQAQSTIENNLKRMTADITASLQKVKAGSAQMNALIRREDRVSGNILTSQSRGSRAGQLTGAAGQSLVSEIRNSADQVTAKITDELVKAYTQKLRTVDDVVAARIRQANAGTGATLRNNTTQAIRNREVLAERRLQDQAYSAQYGAAALTTRNRLASINEDGGSGVIAIQAKLLANYAALSLAFNSMRGLSTFVVQLDKEFRQFQAITATTSTEMVGLKDRLLEVAEASRFSAVEIAKAAVVLGQAGLSSREVTDSIGAISMLATAAGTELTEAVDLVTSTLSIFNLQSSQTTDVANTMTAALNLSKLTVDKLVLGFQYAGNTAAQMGITFQELTGVLGALSNSGIRSGSTLGTGLRQLLIDIQNPTEKFTATLKQLGLTQQDVNVESNGLLPVLRTLASAGFGAAEAFEGFEVRAAAAYVALSNNVDLAAQLQQQFTLSSAATEANAVQMESLANTYDRFISIVGVLAYRAFDPLLQVIQDAMKASADFLAVLNRFPGLLEAIGVAASVLITAATLTAVGSLVKGLVMAAGILPGITAGLTGAAGATVALGAASTGAATGLGAIWAIVSKVNPWIFAASAIIGVVTALYAFGGSSQTAGERLDMLRSQVNLFKGEVDKAGDQITAINQTIDNLIKQKVALDKDPLMRTARILEVKQAFKEISDEVDTTTGSVDQLIDALRNLATTDFGTMASNIRQAISANEALIAQYQNQIAERQVNGPESLRQDTIGQFGGDFLSDDIASGDNKIIEGYAQTLGEKFGRYAAIALGREALPTDVSDLNQMDSSIGAASESYKTRRAILEGKQGLGTITDAELAELNNIPTYLRLLSLLKEQIAPLAANRTNIAQIENEMNIQKGELAAADVKATFQYQDITKDTDVLTSQIGAEYNELLKSTQGKTAEEIMIMFKALEDKFVGQLDALSAEAEGYVDNIVSSTGATPEQVRAAMKENTDRLASLKARIATKINTENLAFQKVQAEILKDESKTLDAAMQSVRKGLSRANTQAEIDYIKEYVLKKYDEKRMLTASIFEAKMAGTTDQDEILGFQSEAREAQQQINIDERTALEDFTQASIDVKTKMLDETKAAIDDQISATNSKMDELLQAIAKSNPGPAMDALITKFNLLSNALQTMQSQSNSIGIQSSVLSGQGRTIPSGMAGKSDAAMKFFMSNGFTKEQAAGIVGNLMTESGMSTSIYGDNGAAYGLAQWHPDRQVGLGALASSRGVGRDDFETQLMYILQELRQNPQNGLAQLQASQTAGEAADTFRKYYERPTADPVKGAHGRRIEYANTLAGNDYATQSQVTDENAADLAAAEYKATTRAIKAAANQNIANSTQQIQTLVKQAGISNDPAAVEKIIASVNQQYKNIIDQKTKIFDQENAAALSENDPEIIAQRQELVQSLTADQNQKISGLLNSYWDAVETQIQQPVDDAKLRLTSAQSPENANKFTGSQILGLQNDVATAEKVARTKELAAAVQLLANVRRELANTTIGTPENNYWLNEEAIALERVTQLTREKKAADDAIVQSAPSVTAAIQSATQAWAIQNGLIDQVSGKMVPLAKQIENSWGQVLDTLTTGFSTLFVDLVSGTMTAEEAFKKFGKSVIDQLLQMIAKALAMQIVMAAFGGSGGGGGGGDWLGTLLGGAFGVTAPGAANGQIVPGNSNRDSVLRKVMPGEAILRRSAVQSMGRENVKAINSLGNRSISGSPMAPVNDNQASSPHVTNVYVVSPDQVPPLGPNDIVAVVSDNIQRRGSINQLIKQVVSG